jgi:hypothetical protein
LQVVAHETYHVRFSLHIFDLITLAARLGGLSESSGNRFLVETERYQGFKATHLKSPGSNVSFIAMMGHQQSRADISRRMPGSRVQIPRSKR